MLKGPIRRGQLIAPLGVGAMIVVKDGTSVIAAGLDHWYEQEDGAKAVNVEEFREHEWRLEKLLDVDHFRTPPDYRVSSRYGSNDTGNTGMTIPFLRFPCWNFCRFCNRLHKTTLSLQSKVECPGCSQKGKTRLMAQVPFVAMCDKGHLQDFPWTEWVHRSLDPKCQPKNLTLTATGGATLASQRVGCRECGAKRSLSRINEADPSGSTWLSSDLSSDKEPYVCQGKRPWLGSEEGEGCGHSVRGSLRSSSNLYFAHVKTSIYVPRRSATVPQKLFDLLEQPSLRMTLEFLKTGEHEIIKVREYLKDQQGSQLKEFSDAQIEEAIKTIWSGEPSNSEDGCGEDDPETGFRRDEYEVIREARDDDTLRIKEALLTDYRPIVGENFLRLTLVEKLRETRVLFGFSRVFPEDGRSVAALKGMLRRRQPKKEDWLPAHIIHGEGIFLELDDKRLRQWEERSEVKRRIEVLAGTFAELQERRRLQDAAVSPRLVLLHTLAHVLMNRLIFECGYSAASLRERLYASENVTAPMSGVLIYTAAGDAEGTMGGLVRMGKPGNLEPVLRRALEGARWCSVDPVCMEIGSSGGQGPDSCNLAACHNCALVPETACEKFNRLLDRGLLTGTPEDPTLGFFPPN